MNILREKLAPMTPLERLSEIEARLKAATPGKSFINLLQSDGCELSLFNHTYTVWLSCKRQGEKFKQTEKDAEMIANAPADLAWLTASLREALAGLEFYASPEAMSCRLRSKAADTPKCLTGDSDYFQDPSDLPLLQDGGDKARTTLASIAGKAGE